MPTDNTTSASRNLLVIYWLVCAPCSYLGGILLRFATNLVGYATFFLGLMFFLVAPILMLSSLALYLFPKETPHLGRKIRIPTILIWVSVIMILWLVDDSDAGQEYYNPATTLLHRIIGGNPEIIWLILSCGFFLTGIISYLTIIIMGIRARFAARNAQRETPPEPQHRQSPRDKRIPGVLLWLGLSIIVPLFLWIVIPSDPNADYNAEIREILILPTFFFLSLLSFVFLVYPNNQSIFSHAKTPVIGFWFMTILALIAWQNPTIIPQHSPTDTFLAHIPNWNNSVVVFYALCALGFWGWLLHRGRHLRQDQTSPT